MTTCPDDVLALAAELAEIGREVTLSHFRQDVAVESKDDASPVTIADRRSEELMRERIARQFPDHGVVGEEYGPSNPGASHQWVIDPVDGTNRFASGHPQFGCLIALLRDNRPILGIIDMPALDERWTGALGHPTTFARHGERSTVRARPCDGLASASLFFGSGNMVRPEFRTALDALRTRARFALYDGDCYAYGLVANGTADVVADSNMGVYDYLPLVAVLEGAGAVITDWDGAALGLQSGGEALAAGDRGVHGAALELLQQAREMQK